MGGSRALVVAAVWTGIVHLILAVLGTFILKRFPTSFAVGFLLGILLVIANQDLILFGTFRGYNFGSPATNQAFGAVGFLIFVGLTLFAVLLFHFKKHVVVAPIDAKGFGRKTPGGGGTSGSSAEESNYKQYDDETSEA